MTTGPAFPPLLLLSDFGGDWSRYVEAVYERFRQDLRPPQPRFLGRRWVMKRHPEVLGKEATFWHVTSEGRDEEERLPDLARCERIGWIRPMLQAAGSPQVAVWEQADWKGRRVLVAVPDFSYVVVVALRDPDMAMLWTAFPVLNDRSRERLRREHARWVAGGGVPGARSKS